MNRLMTPVAIVGASVLGILLLTGGCVWSFHNNCISQETSLVATWEDSQVQYDTFWKTVKEQAQVTDRYADDFKAVFLASIEGRYAGKDPAVQMLMEANPSLDATMYQQLARTIEAGRHDFARTQRTLIDKKREYKKTLAQFPNDTMASRLGFPSELTGSNAPPMDSDGDGRLTVLDYEAITSQTTQDVFRSGHDDKPLDVFGTKG